MIFSDETLRDKFKAGSLDVPAAAYHLEVYAVAHYLTPDCLVLLLSHHSARLFSDELNLERRQQQGWLSYDSEKRTVIRIKSYRISSLKDSGVDLQELTFWRASHI